MTEHFARSRSRVKFDRHEPCLGDTRMSRLACSCILLGFSALGACSSSPSSTIVANDGGAPDAAPVTVPCADPRARPETDCGALKWTASTTKSRKRNHHATVLATTTKGTFLYSLGGFDTSTALANVDRMELTADGSIGTLVEEPALPEPLSRAQPITRPGATCSWTFVSAVRPRPWLRRSQRLPSRSVAGVASRG